MLHVEHCNEFHRYKWSCMTPLANNGKQNISERISCKDVTDRKMSMLDRNSKCFFFVYFFDFCFFFICFVGTAAYLKACDYPFLHFIVLVMFWQLHCIRIRLKTFLPSCKVKGQQFINSVEEFKKIWCILPVNCISDMFFHNNMAKICILVIQRHAFMLYTCTTIIIESIVTEANGV